jgi:hypothetical protein
MRMKVADVVRELLAARAAGCRGSVAVMQPYLDCPELRAVLAEHACHPFFSTWMPREHVGFLDEPQSEFMMNDLWLQWQKQNGMLRDFPFDAPPPAR